MTATETPVAAPAAGTVVAAWRNLHLPGHTWSVRARGSTTVGWRVTDLTVADAQLRVQRGGRARARTSGHRNVHAYVQGAVTDDAPATGWVNVTYTPFDDIAAFRTTDGGCPLTGARWVRLDAHGAWAHTPTWVTP